MNNWRSKARTCIRSDLRWPAATWSRISIPGQRGWDQAAVVRVLNPGCSTTRDRWPVTRPSCVSCVEMNFYIEMESSEASKVFIRKKKSTVHVGRQGLREWRPCASLNYFYGAFLLGFLWPIILLCWFWVHVWFVWILVKRTMGRITSLTMRWWPFSFDLQEILLWTCSQEGLDLKNEEYVVFYLLSGQGCTLLLLAIFGVCVHWGETSAVQPGAHLPPASGRPKFQWEALRK